MNYCPYELDDKPEHFGLHFDHIETSYGTINLVRSEVTGKRVKLFLHGAGGSWVSWTPMLQAAQASGYKTGDMILIDLPGFGDSINIRSDLNAISVGEMLMGLVNKLGWSEVELIGQSMGGFLAIDMASRGFKPIKELIEISGSYFAVLETAQNMRRAIKKHPRAASAYTMMWLLAKMGNNGIRMARQLYVTGSLEAKLEDTVAYPHKLKKSVLVAIVDGMRPKSFMQAARNAKGYDPALQWPRITIPVSGIYGASDHLVPVSDGKRFVALVPHTKLYTIPSAGHFVHIEQPQKVAKIIFS